MISGVAGGNGNGNGHSRSKSRYSDPQSYFAELSKILTQLSHVGIDEIVSALHDAYERSRTIYLFGNGGSAALAQHLACDLTKATIVPGRQRVRAVSLVDNIALLTAWANDAAYADVFAEQLRNLVRPGDVAFAISGSGNSPNVLNALQTARDGGAVTVGISGFAGGRMLGLCDVCVVVPADFMQMIEDVHLAIAHSVSIALRARIAVMTGSSSLVARAASPTS